MNNLVDWETGVAKNAKALAATLDYKYVTTGIIFFAIVARGKGLARDAVVQEFRLTPEKVHLALEATKPKWQRHAKENYIFTQGAHSTLAQLAQSKSKVGLTDDLLRTLLDKGLDADLKRLFVNLELSGDALREIVRTPH